MLAQGRGARQLQEQHARRRAVQDRLHERPELLRRRQVGEVASRRLRGRGHEDLRHRQDDGLFVRAEVGAAGTGKAAQLEGPHLRLRASRGRDGPERCAGSAQTLGRWAADAGGGREGRTQADRGGYRQEASRSAEEGAREGPEESRGREASQGRREGGGSSAKARSRKESR